MHYRIFSFLLACGLSFAAAPLKNLSTPLIPTGVEGGSLHFDFAQAKDLESFDLYTEFGKTPWLMDGALYNWTMCEQKAVLKSDALDTMVITTDIHPINPSGKMDGGIYFGASDAGNAIDGITAWNVNVEHDVSKDYFALKLHRFLSGKWKGAQVEVFNIPYQNDHVVLKVTVINSTVSAFVYDQTKPIFSKALDRASVLGRVGLRSFYSPQYFDYLTLVSPTFTRNTSDFEAEYGRCKALEEKDYTAVSFAPLKELLSMMGNLETASLNQLEIDELTSRLSSARGLLIKRCTFEELTALIAEKKPLENKRDSYTKNSFASFLFALSEAEKMTVSSPIDDIAYWHDMLEKRSDALTRYTVKEAL